MILKRFLLILSAIFLVSCGTDKHDARLHADAIVADLHCDTPLRMVDGFDFTRRDSTGHMDLYRLRDGGVDLQVLACFIASDAPRDSCRLIVDRLIDTIEAQVGRSGGQAVICRTEAEAKSAIEDGKLAIFLGIENGVAIENDLANLEHYYRRGVRYMTLTHTGSSEWCISSADTAPAFPGLTDFGRQVVQTMNRLGMIVDISHASPEAVAEVLKISRDPIIASHSCVYELCSHDRNLTDEQIRAIAANGGLVAINFFNSYLSADWNRIIDSLRTARQPVFDSLSLLYSENDSARHEAGRQVFQEIVGLADSLAPVTVGTMVDHIDHIVKLVGVDYVGLGSDFDGVPFMPQGLGNCSQMPNITAELRRRGYSDGDIEKILGGNFMRLFRKVCDR